jgi:hypothetical protein
LSKFIIKEFRTKKSWRPEKNPFLVQAMLCQQQGMHTYDKVNKATKVSWKMCMLVTTYIWSFEAKRHFDGNSRVARFFQKPEKYA